MFFCAKFAQNKGKTLCSLLVFTQLFRTRNKERSIFAQLTQVSRSCTCAYLKKGPRYAPGTLLYIEGMENLVSYLQISSLQTGVVPFEIKGVFVSDCQIELPSVHANQKSDAY